MADSEGNGWMTTREAAELLGLTEAWALQALRREGIEETYSNGNRNRSRLWNRTQVEQLFKARQPEREQKALGRKRCGICHEWKDQATEFHKRCFVCKVCRPAYDRKRKRERRYPATFANRIPDPQPPGPIGLFVAVGKPPKPGDAEKYACLYGWYQHRPVPPGTTKRRTFCPNCQAPHCYFHPHLKPAVVRRSKRVPRREVEEWV